MFRIHEVKGKKKLYEVEWKLEEEEEEEDEEEEGTVLSSVRVCYLEFDFG